jgi:hypothetical protein
VAETLLEVPVQSQDQTQWCWAAVALGVRDFQLPDAPVMAQCEVVGTVTGDPECCADPERENKEGRLDLALGAFRIPCSTKRVSDFDFGDVQRQVIRLGLPLGVRIADNVTGAGHIVAVIGCDPAVQTVIVADPWGTPGTAAPRYRMAFVNLKHHYGGWGSCSDAFLVA